MQRLFVFDLDGTLANTRELTSGRRTPSMLLNCDPIWNSRDWGYENLLGIDMTLVPGEIAALGHKTAIITRAPRAYASTLAGLLGLESQIVWASSVTDVETKLLALASTEGIPIARVTYIGDSEDDRRSAQSAGCQFVHVDDYDGVEEVERSGVSYELPQTDDVSSIVQALMKFPDRQRAELQSLLSRLVRPEHRYCLIPYETALALGPRAFRFAGVPPTLFTASEHGADYFRFLQNLFPLHRTTSLHEKITEAFYVTEFATSPRSTVSPRHLADPLGRVFSDIKDYRARSGRMTSGPEVELGSLPFIADVLAANLTRQLGALEVVVIDHVAPHPFTDSQPGQVSSWLARWVAEACEDRNGGAWLATRSISRNGRDLRAEDLRWTAPDAVVLLDDQRTQGDSIRSHCRASRLAGYQIALTWSHSRPPTPTGPPLDVTHPVSQCKWPESSPCPMHKPRYPHADLSLLRAEPL